MYLQLDVTLFSIAIEQLGSRYFIILVRLAIEIPKHVLAIVSINKHYNF